MTVSELARTAGFGTSASDKPPFLESVLSDFKGLRRPVKRYDFSLIFKR
jgi:hypothetical protein